MSTANDYHAQMWALATCVDSGVPVILWGPPGCGKTKVIQGLAAHWGRPLSTVIASIHDQTDFAGLPVVNSKTGTVMFQPPDWAKSMAAHERPIGFLDEISTAAPSVQAALLRPVLEGVVGELTLPAGTSWVAAANPPDQAADGYDLSAPLANRFVHLTWVVPPEIVANGYLIGWPESPRVGIDADARDALLVKYRAKVGTYLMRVAPQDANNAPSTSEASGRAWPSSRTWEFLTILLASVDASNVPDDLKATTRLMLATGAVGDAALAFLHWEENMDLPDPEDLIKAGKDWDVPVEQDKVYTIASSVLGALQREVNADRWVSAGDVFGRISEANYGDIAYMFAKEWAGMHSRNSLGARAVPSQYAMTNLTEIMETLEQLSQQIRKQQRGH